MKLSIFENTAVKIISSAVISLTFFALLAGQSASAGQFSAKQYEDDTAAIAALEDNQFSRALTLVADLEEHLLNAAKQMKVINDDYKKGKVSKESLFIATVTYFNIEQALHKAEGQLTGVILQMQNNETELANDASQSAFAFTKSQAKKP
jgi:exonuclease VII small subunit